MFEKHEVKETMDFGKSAERLRRAKGTNGVAPITRMTRADLESMFVRNTYHLVEGLLKSGHIDRNHAISIWQEWMDANSKHLEKSSAGRTNSRRVMRQWHETVAKIVEELEK